MRVPRWGVSVAAVAALVGAGLSVPQVAAAADAAPPTAWSPPAVKELPKEVLPASPNTPWRPRSTTLPVDSASQKQMSRSAAASATATVAAPGIGELPWFTFEKFPVSKTSIAQVNVANGNLLVKANDLTIASPGAGLRQDRFYNSMSALQGTAQSGQDGTIGDGWGFNSSRGDVGLNIQSTYADFHGPNGTTIRFTGSKGAWTAPAGSNMTVTAPKTGDASYIVTINRTGEQWQFDPQGKLLGTVDRNGAGNTIGKFLDATGVVTGSAPNSTSKKPWYSFSYAGDSEQYPLTMDDSSGRQWKFLSDAGVQAPDGTTTHYTYAGNRLASIISPSAVAGQTSTTSFTYDGQGRVLTVSQQTTAQGNPAVSKFSYAAGVTTQVDPNGNTSSYQVDSQGRVTKTTDGRGKTRAQSWTANSDVQTTTDGLTTANVTKYEFDGNNNTTKASLPTGAAATASYSVGGSCSVANSGTVYEPKCSTDSSGNKATFQYDTAGNLLQQNDTTSSTAKITAKYTYEKAGGSVCGGLAGQVCSSTDGNGNTTKNTYDTSGNLLKVTPPAPLGATTYTYDSLNRVTSVTDGKGQKTQYTYDVADRVVKTTYSNGAAVTTSYYPNGLAKTVDDSAGGTQQFTYDARGALTAQTGPNAASAAQYGYDANGNLTAATDTSGTVGYGYDAANNLTQVTDPGGSCPTGSAAPAAGSGCVRLQYDDNEQESTRQLPGGAIIAISRDNSARPVRITAKDTSGAAKFDVGYSYAKAGTDQGLIQTRTSYAEQGITAGAVTTYGYDSRSELTSAIEAAGGTTTASWAYAYDGAGNRTSQTLAGTTNSPRSGTTTFTYNAANQLTRTSADTAVWGYDADGVQTKNGITGAAQTVDPRLAVTSTGTGGVNSYFGDGNTTRTTAGSTAYGTTPLGITSITTNGATSSYTRTPTGALIDGRQSAGSFYYVTDAIGSVTGLFDATGAWAGGYSYAPYGETRSISTNGAVTANPFRYISGLNEGGNLYKLGARYYDADLGRFTQMDPSGQETNPYAYASCNPINASDPSGLSCARAILDASLASLSFGLAVAGLAGLGTIAALAGGALTAAAAAAVVDSVGIAAVVSLGISIIGAGEAVSELKEEC